MNFFIEIQVEPVTRLAVQEREAADGAVQAQCNMICNMVQATSL
jgi:hypothetical protein